MIWMPDPTVSEMLATGRSIFPERLTAQQIVVRAAKVLGDLAAVARAIDEGEHFQGDLVDDAEREIGNLILSGIRWADDLGLDPAECVAVAERAQRAYAAKRECQ